MAETATVARWPRYLKDRVVKDRVEKLGTSIGDLFVDDERLDAVTDDTRKLQRYQEYVERLIAERVADFIADGLDVDSFEEWDENGAIDTLLSEPSGEAPGLAVVR